MQASFSTSLPLCVCCRGGVRSENRVYFLIAYLPIVRNHLCLFYLPFLTYLCTGNNCQYLNNLCVISLHFGDLLVHSQDGGKGQALKDKFQVPFLPKSRVNRAPVCSELTLFHSKAKADPCLTAVFRLHQGICRYWSDISNHFKLRECGPGNHK